MQQFLNRHPAIYTPWLLGVTACVGIYFALAGMVLPGRLPPAWVWVSTLLLPLVGLTVQLRVRRVVYIHVFNVICYFAVTAAYGSLLWALLVSEDNTIDKTFTAILVTVSLILTSLIAFLVDQRRPERATMPTGRQGRLNQRSGIIEDKGYLAPPVEDVTTANQIAQAILKASPLIAGLTIAFTRKPTISGKIALLALGVAMVSLLLSLGTGLIMSFLVATIRWEKQHGKQIYIRQ